MQRRTGWHPANGVPWAVLAAVCVALFVVLTVVVAGGAADSLDGTVARRFRPEEAWGEPQDRVAPWLTRLAPERMFGLLAVTCLAVAAWRRSWGSVAFGVVTGLCSVAATLLVKVALARVDPLGGISPDGGSYPSGHMVAVVVSVATCLLVLLPRVRWWCWLVLAVPSGVMAVSLVVTTSHWVSDVVGGALLAGAVVATASWLWSGRHPRARSGVPEWEEGQQNRGESTR
ncbi:MULTISPECIES: hypothetical protein [unclassified Knoellia]|uniref:hypothetical protein n=1 Tax=Knoellia altitudinis TaxID=3404795 RepID=UPI003616A4E0